MASAWPGVPKGAAMALHLTPEYEAGRQAYLAGETKNPFDFFDNYTEFYAWDIGWQNAKHKGE